MSSGRPIFFYSPGSPFLFFFPCGLCSMCVVPRDAFAPNRERVPFIVVVSTVLQLRQVQVQDRGAELTRRKVSLF